MASEGVVNDASDRSIHEGLSLSGPIVTYLRAVNIGGADEFATSFADDAVVVDVNRELRGLDAIADWARTDIFWARVHFDVLDVTEARDEPSSLVKIDGRSIERDYPILS